MEILGKAAATVARDLLIGRQFAIGLMKNVEREVVVMVVLLCYAEMNRRKRWMAGINGYHNDHTIMLVGGLVHAARGNE